MRSRFHSISLFSALVPMMVCPLVRGETLPATQPARRNDALNVRYGPAAGQANLLDVFRSANIDGKLPLIIWIHGGGWSGGDKERCPALVATTNGYVVASINYRLTDAATYPAQIEDCKGAIRFLRAHSAEYHIDPEKIGVWGASAGGHLVALLGTSGDSKEIEGTVGGNLDQSSRVQAVCDWFGPTDLGKIVDQAKAAGFVDVNFAAPLVVALLGGTPTIKVDNVRLANPISFITAEHAKQIPPFLIMHGDKDNIVPVAQSQMLADALKSAGVPVQLTIIKNAGHGTGFAKPSIGTEMAAFFDRNLKGQ